MFRTVNGLQKSRRRAARKKLGKSPARRRVPLLVEPLEDRIEPAPFVSTGGLGDLLPTTAVDFNTADGTYRIDNGAWRGGGVLSPDALQSTMLYNFASINMTLLAERDRPLADIGLGLTSNRE